MSGEGDSKEEARDSKSYYCPPEFSTKHLAKPGETSKTEWKENMSKLLDIQDTLETLVEKCRCIKPDPFQLQFGMLSYGLEYNRSVEKIREFQTFLLKAQFEDDWEKWDVKKCGRGEDIDDLWVIFCKKGAPKQESYATFSEY